MCVALCVMINGEQEKREEKETYSDTIIIRFPGIEPASSTKQQRQKRRNQCNTILFRLSHYTFTRMIIWFDSTVRAKVTTAFRFPFFFLLSVQFSFPLPFHSLLATKMCGKFGNSSLIAIICHLLIRELFFSTTIAAGAASSSSRSAFYLRTYISSSFYVFFFSLSLLIISLLIH